MKNIIDVHMHYLPNIYRASLLAHGTAGSESDGLPAPQWSVESHLETMDNLGIEKAILSLASPHPYWGDPKDSAHIIHTINQEGAYLVKQHPDRFLLAPTLPLPDVEASLKEIAYAYDELHAVAIKLPTSVGGVYLGNPILAPIWEELNTRQAVIILHPGPSGYKQEGVLENCPPAVLDYMMETTKTIIDMIIKGFFTQYPNVRFVVPHGGALISAVADRVVGMEGLINMKANPDVHNIKDIFKQLYFDIAGFAVPNQLAALLQMTDVDHLLYGSDFPYAFPAYIQGEKEKIEATQLLSDSYRQKIFRDNAKALFNL